MNKERYEGLWWLENDLNNKVNGFLYGNNDEGYMLSLNGVLDSQYTAGGITFPQAITEVTIIGKTVNGKHIRLNFCQEIERRNNFSSYSPQETIFE